MGKGSFYFGANLAEAGARFSRGIPRRPRAAMSGTVQTGLYSVSPYRGLTQLSFQALMHGSRKITA